MLSNIKYAAFYALLILIAILGFYQYHWIIIVPAALILTVAYILVQGSEWRQVMGKSDLNGGVVAIAIFVVQLILASLFLGAGRILSMLLN